MHYHPLLPISAFQGQDNGVIAKATKEIQQLTLQFMEKLDARAKALANGAQFDLGLRDAAVMRAVVPTSPLGYLRAGSIYQQQGRQKEAIVIYDQGLLATHESDPSYTCLAEGRTVALEMDTRRIDFISQLPNDIVSTNIAPLLFENDIMDSEAPCSYLDVSSTWQHRLLQCNPLNYITDMNDNDPSFKFASHAKSLWFRNMQGPAADHKVIPFLQHDWKHLTHLTISCIVAKNQRNLLGGMALVSDTLTHVVITIIDPQVSSEMISVKAILDTCPHLTSLETSGIDYTLPDMLSKSYPNMTHINLHSDFRDAIPSDIMMNIISHLPSLKSLITSPMPAVRILSMIQDHCPDLKLLHYGREIEYDRLYHEKQGLEKLAVGDVYDEYDAEDVMPILKQHCATLQEIHFAGHMDASRISPQDDPQLAFNQLRALYFKGDAPCIPLATWIIHRAPFIKTLSLMTDLAGNIDLFGVISPLKHLKSLCLWPMPPYWDPIHQLIQHHVHLGNASTLQELHIALHYDTVVSPWLCAITQLRRLTSLKISIQDRNIPDTYQAVMDTLAQGCLQLESFELICENIVPPGVIFPFHHHPHLQRVHVSGNGLHWSDILGLLAIPKLTSLVLQVPEFPDEIRQLLKNKIAFVDIKHRVYVDY